MIDELEKYKAENKKLKAKIKEQEELIDRMAFACNESNNAIKAVNDKCIRLTNSNQGLLRALSNAAKIKQSSAGNARLIG